MGLDAVILVDQITPETDMFIAAEFEKEFGWLREDFGEDTYLSRYPYFENGQVHSLMRFYGYGYERGNWPILREIIMFLWQFEVPVRYGHDCADDQLIITPKEVCGLDDWWNEHGHLHYSGYKWRECEGPVPAPKETWLEGELYERVPVRAMQGGKQALST